MKLSQFGHKLSAQSGIVSLMEDLGEALNINPDILFLGGGNPALVPEFEKLVSRHLSEIAKNPQQLHKLVGVYQSPRGSESFIAALVKYVNQRCGWSISPANVAITNGSQSAFFILINLLTGQSSTSAGEVSEKKKLLFPMMPEYLGYADQASEEGVLRSYLPRVVEHEQQRFKYHVDFSRLEIHENDAALCVSRPTNPSGNLLSQDEMSRLSRLASDNNIPFIVDCAYGEPMPGIVYEEDKLEFDANTVYVMSCSKLGLPGARTGMVIGPERIIDRVVNANTIVSLASGNMGPSIVTSMMERGDLDPLCRNTLLPFYRQRRDFAVRCVEKYLNGLNYRLHEPQGAFFLWLWFPDLAVNSEVLYQRVKKKGVLIMSGSHFFFGVDEKWRHAEQCVRLTYCQDERVIDEGIRLLAEEVKALHA